MRSSKDICSGIPETTLATCTVHPTCDMLRSVGDQHVIFSICPATEFYVEYTPVIPSYPQLYPSLFMFVPDSDRHLLFAPVGSVSPGLRATATARGSAESHRSPQARFSRDFYGKKPWQLWIYAHFFSAMFLSIIYSGFIVGFNTPLLLK